MVDEIELDLEAAGAVWDGGRSQATRAHVQGDVPLMALARGPAGSSQRSAATCEAYREYPASLQAAGWARFPDRPREMRGAPDPRSWQSLNYIVLDALHLLGPTSIVHSERFSPARARDFAEAELGDAKQRAVFGLL